MTDYKNGGATITIDDSLDTMVRDAIRGILPEFSSEILRSMESIVDKAESNWPVRAKRSRGSARKIKASLTVSQGKIMGRITNSAPYAAAIKAGKNSDLPRGTNISDALLWEPLRELSPELSARLADDIIKLQD